MKGLKTIRTSNWDEMTSFYAEKLAMSERDHDDKDTFREFADFGTEIHLERVQTSDQHELLGSLELYSVDPDGLATSVRKRRTEIRQRIVGGQTELMLSDPDGHILTIVRRE